MKKSLKTGFVALVPAAVITLAALAVGTVATAQVSLPGSPLYGIKTSTEKVRLAIAFTPEMKAKTHLSIAAEKLTELEKLSAKGVSGNEQAGEKVEKMEKVEENFEKHQDQAKGYIKNIEKKDEKQTKKLIDNEVRKEKIKKN